MAYHAACRILIPQPVADLRHTAVKVQNPNHYTYHQGMPHSRLSLCLKTVGLSTENQTEEKKKREIKNAKGQALLLSFIFKNEFLN